MAETGLVFEVIASGYEEDMTLDLPPTELAKNMAAGKAEDVARANPDAVVLAADTIVVLDGKPLGKPKTPERATEYLNGLSGRAHSVITGFAVRCDVTGRCDVTAVETRVFFRTLTAAEIAAYVSSGEPLDRAGAYAIQGIGRTLVDRIEGDYWNVVGLPKDAVVAKLREYGIGARRG